MSQNIPNHFVTQFSTNVSLLLQQKGSKLRNCVTTGSHVGKQASPVDQFGAIEAQLVTSRFAPMTRIDASADRRWVYPSDYDIPQIIDSFDKLKLLTDPSSAYVTNAMYGLGRQMDRAIISATLGTAKTGETGSTSTSFTSGNEVDVATGGANSALNVDKMLAVLELMRARNIDLDSEEVFMAIPAKDYSALLAEVEITSSDFNGGIKPVLQDGKIVRFLGINIVHCELVETLNAGTNEVTIPVWVKSGMYLGLWEDIKTSIDVRADLQSRPWQAYAQATFGATRLEENKVFAIESYRA